MKRTLFLIGCGLAAGFGLGLWASRGDARQASAVEATVAVVAPPPASHIVASGRVEPASEEIEVQSKLVGRLKAVLVNEGDCVTAGQPLAMLDAEDIAAAERAAAARVAMAEAELERLVAGARQEERREAHAAVAQAEASRAYLQREVERTRALFKAGALSASDLDRAESELAVAAAREQAQRERAAFVQAPARDDERSRAEAALEAARAQWAQARAYAADTVIRAPISGVVVHRHRQAGESVSPESPVPVLTLAGEGPLRVRVEVDERDVARVAPNQAVFVTADAFGERRFAGRVLRVGERLGRKRIQTDDPAERRDTAVLETLVALDDDVRLPLDLRVTAFIQVSPR